MIAGNKGMCTRIKGKKSKPNFIIASPSILDKNIQGNDFQRLTCQTFIICDVIPITNFCIGADSYIERYQPFFLTGLLLSSHRVHR